VSSEMGRKGTGLSGPLLRMVYPSSLRGIQLFATTQLVMSLLKPQLFDSYSYVSFINLAIRLLEIVYSNEYKMCN
jgi:hypothetical protein